MFRYRSIKYGVANKRLITKKGMITTITIEIPIDRIESINNRQGLFGMLFNYGYIPKYERPEKPKPKPIDDTLLYGIQFS
jgi:hypothetical protein